MTKLETFNPCKESSLREIIQLNPFSLKFFQVEQKNTLNNKEKEPIKIELDVSEVRVGIT
jgi:hypothetical protein